MVDVCTNAEMQHEREVRKLKEEIARLTTEAESLRNALCTIAAWELPATGEHWPSGAPVSYGANYGSNGERGYMRSVAKGTP